MPEFAIGFFHLQRADRNLVELLGVGAVGAFDGAVEFKIYSRSALSQEGPRGQRGPGNPGMQLVCG